MTEPKLEVTDWPLGPHGETLEALVHEMQSARGQHPGNLHLLAALMEEVGELAQALLERQSTGEIRGEALQVATVALRIFEEGEPEFDFAPYPPAGRLR